MHPDFLQSGGFQASLLAGSGHQLNPAAPLLDQMEFVEDASNPRLRNLEMPCMMSSIVRPNGRRPGFSISIRSSNKATRMGAPDRKSTRLNSSHLGISYAVF